MTLDIPVLDNTVTALRLAGAQAVYSKLLAEMVGKLLWPLYMLVAIQAMALWIRYCEHQINYGNYEKVEPTSESEQDKAEINDRHRE